jgi:hypothetical protein
VVLDTGDIVSPLVKRAVFYEITDTEQTQRFDPEKVIFIEKFNPEKVITAVYLDKDKLQFNIKRFKIETSTLKTPFSFIKEGNGNYVAAVTTHIEPILVVISGKGTQARKAKFKVSRWWILWVLRQLEQNWLILANQLKWNGRVK